jgi:hypothetical protein
MAHGSYEHQKRYRLIERFETGRGGFSLRPLVFSIFLWFPWVNISVRSGLSKTLCGLVVGESGEVAYPERSEGGMRSWFIFCVLLPFSLFAFHCIMGLTVGSYGQLSRFISSLHLYLSGLSRPASRIRLWREENVCISLLVLCVTASWGWWDWLAKHSGNSGAGCVGVESVKRSVLILARWQVFHQLVCLLHGVGVACGISVVCAMGSGSLDYPALQRSPVWVLAGGVAFLYARM